MIFRAVDHVGFTVSNLDRSVEFYTLLLDQPPMSRKTWDVPYLGRIAGYPNVKLEAAFWQLSESLVLELMEYHRPAGARVDMETYNAGNAHVAFVTADIHRDFARLQGHAVFRSPAPVAIEWGPYQGGWAGRLRDADGISIELVQHPPGGPKLV